MLSEEEVSAVYWALRRRVEELSELSREDLLKALPQGDFRDQWSCPLALDLVCEAYLALRGNPSVLGVKVLPGVAECYAWEHEWDEHCELIATVELSPELSDFIRRFDAGEYPQLIRPESLEE
jgi:hypothetical protein